MYINHSEFSDIKYIVEQLLVAPSPVTSLTMEFALTSSTIKSWQDKFKTQIMENTKLAVQLFEDQGIQCVIPEGCFFVFPKLPFDDDLNFKKFLLEKFGVEVVAGFEFGPAGKGHIRINCATSRERVTKGIKIVIEGIKEFNK